MKEENTIMNEFDNDAHSCRANASDYGICTVCGAIVSGTSADYELHGYDPPEIDRYHVQDRLRFRMGGKI